MRKVLEELLRDEDGQDLAEYAIALSIVGLGAGIAAVGVSLGVNSLWSKAVSATAFVLGS